MKNHNFLDSPSLIAIAQLSKADTLKTLNTSMSGLSPTESNNRINKYGNNSFADEKQHRVIMLLLSTLKNPLILILLLVSLISFGLGETVNSAIIALMVILSVSINFFQEYKANETAKKLKDKIAHKTCVYRDGKIQEIISGLLVPGDIVELNAGDLIPADMRVLEAKDLYVNQASLTGESYPVVKIPDYITNDKDQITGISNLVFSGTSVITGRAICAVVKTGLSSEFGNIVKNSDSPIEENSFTTGIHHFSIMILKIVLFFVLFIFLVNALLKHDMLEALTFSIAVAVGLTPEFLPMIMSVAMGKGSLNMAKKGVVVKKLTAIPSFGSMNILCTDKTGTLTEAKIRLIKYIDVDGKHSDDVFNWAYLNSKFQAGITNPMDEAVLLFKNFDVNKYKKIDEIPFDFARKKMSVILEHDQKRTLITKGSPEDILSVCSYCRHKGKTILLSSNEKRSFEKYYNELSRDGFRVLAVAIKQVNNNSRIFTKNDENKMILIGLAAFLDPAKSGTKEILDQLEEHHIEIKVLTGDNELVTQKICNDVGVNIKGILLGKDIATFSDIELIKKIKGITIFARCSPIQKTRIIEALKKGGNVVGYMGDGINDTTSLETADVGISVENAVDVAKEAADIILTNKNLSELVDGVVEGRKTFGNTMKYILMGLSSNFGNMFSVLGAVIFLPFLPMLPIQILLNNFLYDFSQLTIPSDSVDREYILSPKRWDINFIRRFMFIFGPISSLYDFITFGMMYLLFNSSPSHFQTGWFMESLATQTLVIHVIRTRLVPISQSRASLYLWLSTLFVVLVGWIMPYTPIGKFFGFSALPPLVIIFLILTVLAYLLTAEIGKRYFYRKLTNQL